METFPSLACIGFSVVTSSDPSNHCCLSNVLVDRHFQVSHEMIDWVEVRPPAGPLKDTHRVPLNHSWVVLTVCLESLLKGRLNLQPSLRSWVLCITFSSTLPHSGFPQPRPASLSQLLKNTPTPLSPPSCSMMLPLPHTRDAIVRVRSGACFPSNMTPQFKDNTLNLGFYPDKHFKLR